MPHRRRNRPARVQARKRRLRPNLKGTGFRRKDSEQTRRERFMLIPTVVETTPTGREAYDIWSRLMKDRIVFLGDAIDDHIANVLIAQFLFLEKEDADKDIEFYINSPGGSVSAVLAIYDTMQLVKCEIATTCVGMAAS